MLPIDRCIFNNKKCINRENHEPGKHPPGRAVSVSAVGRRVGERSWDEAWLPGARADSPPPSILPSGIFSRSPALVTKKYNLWPIAFLFVPLVTGLM